MHQAATLLQEIASDVGIHAATLAVAWAARHPAGPTPIISGRSVEQLAPSLAALDVTLDEMILVAAAVRRGTTRALVSCDFPYGPLQQGPAQAAECARRLIDETGVDIIKLDAAADHLAGVEAVVRTGAPVFAQFGMSPQTAARYGVDPRDTVTSRVSVPDDLIGELVEDARRLESAGAALLNFSNSGAVAGTAVVEAVSIPVLGGSGGGPWLDGRIRLLSAAIGYDADTLDSDGERTQYAEVARIVRGALDALVSDIRGGTVLRGQPADERLTRST
jgi:3-methyl-2-oxobutanoate hydroxymethyltransferase